ncbi:MAG: alpha/beta hydrolase [Pseudomonadota bacterium]
MPSALSLTLAALVLLLLAVVGFVQLRAHQAERAAENAYPAQGALIDVNGRKVHAVTQGSGPDLVIIHGASGNTYDYTMSFVAPLLDRYRVTVFDRPGFGWSDRSAGYGGPFDRRSESPKEQAQMLREAAQKLGITDPIILGHSYGGAVTLAWALEYPEDPAALVMLSAVSNPWPGSVDRIHHINASVLGAAVVVPLATAFANAERLQSVLATIFAPQSPPEAYYAASAVPLAIRRNSLRLNAKQITRLKPFVIDMVPNYGAITVPTEILHGTADTIVSLKTHSEPLSQQLPDATLTPLPGIGHMPHHVVPEAVNAAIDRASARAGLR